MEYWGTQLIKTNVSQTIISFIYDNWIGLSMSEGESNFSLISNTH